MTPIELLAPAKNADVGIAAINHGADAVYIGSPLFSARAAAGNSIKEIERLVQHAHTYGAKVLVALNTILTDAELPQAQTIIHQLYQAGADALIIQDLGLLQLDLPPIALHASTQCDNRTPSQVALLEQAGFKRVVLARELSLDEIAAIRATTTVELEAFVHGALCVSYSGQCYLSQAACGRSANRGNCAQLCRLPYDLLDANREPLLQHKHLLSLKDLDRSQHLLQMMQAGVTTFKIEGRLKDEHYVKNIVAYYRQHLDALLDNSEQFQPASWGKTTFFFTPNPQKTFHRGETDYFLHHRNDSLIQMDTPKSVGEPIGKVIQIQKNSLTLAATQLLSNGDGLCFADTGFMVNRVEGNRIYPAKMPRIAIGTPLYRNHDHAFEKQLQQKTAQRTLPLCIHFSETPDGFLLQLHQPDSKQTVTLTCISPKEPARQADTAIKQIEQQLSKLGNSHYTAQEVTVALSQPWFLPAARLNEWRRTAIEQLDAALLQLPRLMPKATETAATTATVPATIAYHRNVHNQQAKQFYQAHGATQVAPSFETLPPTDARLMTCRYCLKHELGWCPKQRPTAPPKEPLYLRSKQHMWQLNFDCKQCEMFITAVE